MDTQNQENKENQILTEEQFVLQMKDLVKKAPKSTTMIITVMTDVEKERGEGIIAAQGSPLNLIYALNKAFKESRDFEKIIFDSVKFRKELQFSRGNGLKSVLDEFLKKDNRGFAEYFKEMMDNMEYMSSRKDL